MDSDDEMVTIDLTDDERNLMVHGLNEYFGSGKQGARLLAPVMGVSTVDEFHDLVMRLRVSIDRRNALSDLDWARALLLTEISWASDLAGSGIDFATNIRDEQAAPLMRSIQYQVSNYHRFKLLLDNAKLVAD
jgi:hypothetical protein